MSEDHHVFIHLETLRVYVLPDNYEVHEASLNDIKYAIQPTFTQQDVDTLDRHPAHSHDLHKKKYLPGYVGLNNIKENDYINVILQALAHVDRLRDPFLLQTAPTSSELGKRARLPKHGASFAAPNNAVWIARRFGALIRKLWNPRAFKCHVSPHEFVQVPNHPCLCHGRRRS
jgi:U4/U6.U5 tri-snRNP-associated protein 2